MQLVEKSGEGNLRLLETKRNPAQSSFDYRDIFVLANYPCVLVFVGAAVPLL